MNERITIETHIDAPVEKVWRDYTNPDAIKIWNTPSEDWHTTHAENDVRAGGAFLSRMEAKDGSAGFDFAGTYDEVAEGERLAYTMTDGRKAEVSFAPMDGGTHVTAIFDPEAQNPHDVQQAGWQAILDSFKAYAQA